MTFLRNCWYVAGFSEDVSNKPFARTYLGETVVIYRADDGRPVAMANECPHRYAPLDRGQVFGDQIRCPYHGLRFDSQGQCVHMPLGGEAPPRARLKVYPVTERYELLWIWMGDPALATPESIPDFSYLIDPSYGWFNGQLYARAEYQLLVDNLLDLSHAEFLHPMLSSDGWSGRNEATTTREGDTIHVRNVAENDNILPIMAQLRPDMAKIGATIQHERWDAPALLRLSVEYYSEGEQIIIPSGHFLTPESENTTHYFVRGGQGVAPDNPEVNAGMRAGVLAIFQHEDIPLIEAQQRYLGDTELMDRRPAILKSDAAAVMVRRLLARKIKMEDEVPAPADLVAAQ